MKWRGMLLGQVQKIIVLSDGDAMLDELDGMTCSINKIYADRGVNMSTMGFGWAITKIRMGACKQRR